MKRLPTELLSGTAMRKVTGLSILAGGAVIVGAVSPGEMAAHAAQPVAESVQSATTAANAVTRSNPQAQPRPATIHRTGAHKASERSACNPCAARCSPCAAKTCNPCAANPCNPCGAGGSQNHSSTCNVPRLAAANPCAARNPCAAKACNPCTAKACNPCAAKNPCAANACNPCNPCAAGEAVELTGMEAIALQDCLADEMLAAYAISGLKAANYGGWSRYSVHAYASATHGGRFVNNYANAKGSAYGKFESSGQMPVGAVLAKPSFQVTPGGKVTVGPLFLMEKMKPGFRVESGDWKYTMVMPTGAVAGVTNGKGSGNVAFCIACHAAVGDDQDHMFFLPDNLRIGN